MPSFSRALVYVWKGVISESLIPTGGRRVGDLLCYHHMLHLSPHIVSISRSRVRKPLICALRYVKQRTNNEIKEEDNRETE